ncbi:SusC/RagA family TonB-linked outer membrane protein [Capnocytophaga canimorsus]|uniref:SusC/RagA family TonB-linked outer membrane protein n=1 Tax=Capnocytophaga canimorsus TaxID=28188 RepID=UPI001561EF3B|nr:TonB-dependent receptor [Capnocytophaga canimorsus]
MKDLLLRKYARWSSVSLLMVFVFVFSFQDLKADNIGNDKGRTIEDAQQQKTITGTVIDEQGQPLPGVSIIVKGKQGKGTSTDFDGKYAISVLPTDRLVFSYIGFAQQEVLVGNKSVVNVTMKEDTQQLDDVVVTAYGTGQKKVSVVGSVQTVKPKELKIPSTNLSTSFAGRMAGVIAVQRGGQPGADGADFWIRGISTFGGATNPLIILDGVQVSAGDLNAIDPEVIESFSVLKDATATALYGSRGANGVMIVTTKSGSDLDKPIINLRVEGNMSEPSRLPQFVDGVSYMKLYNEGVANLGSGVLPYSQEKIDGTAAGLNPYVFPNVDWYNEIFKQRAFNQKVHMNIRGGGKKLTYFLSGSLNRDTGMVKDISRDYFSFNNNINYMRYAFQNNIDLKLGEFSKIGLKINSQFIDKRDPRTGVKQTFEKIMNANPVDFPIRYEQETGSDITRWGGYLGGTDAAGTNPFSNLVAGYTDTFESTVIANIDFNQKLDFWVKGLQFTALGSFKNWSQSQTIRKAPLNTFGLASYKLEPDGTYSYVLNAAGEERPEVLETTAGTTGNRRIYLQGILDYTRKFGVHDVNALLIYNQEETSLNNIHHDQAFQRLLNSLPRRSQGISSRLSYAYDNRYLAEFNVGYNGSENFAKGRRFGIFPSIALGYNISEEKFFEPIKDVVSWLKLRGSWGLVGNDRTNAARFAYMSSINLRGRSFTSGVDQNYTKYGPTYTRYENLDLTWEVGEKINLGVDLQLFSQFNLTFEAFQEIRSKIFQERGTIPTYLGTADTKVLGNLAKVKNWGFDASLDYARKIGQDWFLSAKGTFTFARNKILEYDEPVPSHPGLSRIGQRLNVYQGYVADRLFIDQAEVDNSVRQQISGNVAAGDIKYINMPDKDGKYDDLIDGNDKVYIGHPTVPEIVYGFGFNLKYKSIDVGAFFQGAANTSLMMSGFHPFGTQSRRNVLKFVAEDYWTPENQNIYAAYPRLTHDDHENNTVASTYWLRDASFLKFKSFEVGYTPERFKNMRIYASGLNLLTFSNFKHWDPEQGSNPFNYPTQRVLNFGVQITIN